jgi:hypothetical protein
MLIRIFHSDEWPKIKALQQKLRALSEVLRQSDAEAEQLRYECHRGLMPIRVKS